MSFTVRPALRQDAPALAAVELLTAPEFATFLLDGLFEGVSTGAALSAIYAREGTDSYEWSWIAEADGETVGAIGAYPVSLVNPPQDTGEAAARIAYYEPIKRIMRPDAFHISRLGVLEPYRRRGIAGAMLEQAIAVAGARGERRVTLLVWADNASAIAFYTASGFAETDSLTLPAHPRAMRHGSMILLERALC